MKLNQKIFPFLWFEDQAEEAVRFYVSVFPDSQIDFLERWPDETPFPDGSTAGGKVQQMAFRLSGMEFFAFDAGPMFQFNPSISFFVNCNSGQEVEDFYSQLAEGGQILMPLDTYPFSEKYAWVQDRFGVSWQLILSGVEKSRKIFPSLMFVQDNAGKAEGAMEYYTSLFGDSSILSVNRYGPGMEPNHEHSLAYGEFELEGELFAAMDSAGQHDFQFNEAISLYVDCVDQTEIDYFWNKMTEDGQESACGWLKDRYGVSWQIVPSFLLDILEDGTKGNTEAMMLELSRMKKLDEARLKEAYFK